MNYKLYPYLVIEDDAMMSLRTKTNWAYKGMPEEVLLPLIDALRNEIYFLGLRRILFKLNRGKDFKLIASWESGVAGSFQYLCRSIDRKENYKSLSSYALVATCKDSDGKRTAIDILSTPFFRQKRMTGKYAMYIAKDTLQDYKNRVGRCDGGTLFINSPQYTKIEFSNLEDSDDMGRLAAENQIQVLKSLMKGNDFILSPYGHSLQMLMQDLTTRQESILSEFKLTTVSGIV